MLCKIGKNLVPIIQSYIVRTVERSFYYLSLQVLIEVKLLTSPPWAYQSLFNDLFDVRKLNCLLILLLQLSELLLFQEVAEVCLELIKWASLLLVN